MRCVAMMMLVLAFPEVSRGEAAGELPLSHMFSAPKEGTVMTSLGAENDTLSGTYEYQGTLRSFREQLGLPIYYHQNSLRQTSSVMAGYAVDDSFSMTVEQAYEVYRSRTDANDGSESGSNESQGLFNPVVQLNYRMLRDETFLGFGVYGWANAGAEDSKLNYNSYWGYLELGEAAWEVLAVKMRGELNHKTREDAKLGSRISLEAQVNMAADFYLDLGVYREKLPDESYDSQRDGFRSRLAMQLNGQTAAEMSYRRSLRRVAHRRGFDFHSSSTAYSLALTHWLP